MHGKTDAIDADSGDRKQYALEAARKAWAGAIEYLETRADDLMRMYEGNADKVKLKFELSRHKALIKSVKGLAKELGDGEHGRDIRSEKRNFTIKEYINSFVSNIELMHEVDFYEKLHILERKADITELVSRGFFDSLADLFGIDSNDAANYISKLDEAENRLIFRENELNMWHKKLRRAQQ